jgi:hypothetical protein
MSLMIAVKSCAKDMERGCHDVIRATWGAALRGAILKFFIGRETDGLEGRVIINNRTSYNFKSDEVALDCRDDYEGLVFKTRAICQYVIGKNIDHVMMVGTDCCVFPNRVLSSNFRVADYAGKFNGKWGDTGPREMLGPNGIKEVVERCYSWADGGGYFLSRCAAFEIAETFPKPNKYLVGSYEDFWVGQILGPLVARGDLISMPLADSVCLTPEDRSCYDPKSGWMEKTWKEFQGTA